MLEGDVVRLRIDRCVIGDGDGVLVQVSKKLVVNIKRT